MFCISPGPSQGCAVLAYIQQVQTRSQIDHQTASFNSLVWGLAAVFACSGPCSSASMDSLNSAQLAALQLAGRTARGKADFAECCKLRGLHLYFRSTDSCVSQYRAVAPCIYVSVPSQLFSCIPTRASCLGVQNFTLFAKWHVCSGRRMIIPMPAPGDKTTKSCSKCLSPRAYGSSKRTRAN